MSQVNDPEAPQREVENIAGANKQAHVGPYVDRDLTQRNATSTAPDSDIAPKSGSTTTGGVRASYAADQKSEIENDDAATENAGVDAPPTSPNSWRMQTRNGQRFARDPYANGGQAGYLDND